MSKPATTINVAGFKKFTGIVAPDGTTHKTQREAIEHIRKVSIDKNVTELAKKIFAERKGVHIGIINEEELADFLKEVAADLAAATTIDIRQRAPRADRGVKRKPVVQTASETGVVAG